MIVFTCFLLLGVATFLPVAYIFTLESELYINEQKTFLFLQVIVFFYANIQQILRQG